LLSYPDPSGLPIDQKVGGDIVCWRRHTIAADVGGGGETGGLSGGIQDETDPTGIVVPTSTIIPAELGLQLDEATLVGLEIIEEGHTHSSE
jgi:hypothetical protein